MTQIVLNPDQLAQTASFLQNAAGEYQAIGAQVYGCDCGCMPADVAATVDSATAAVRSSLQGISSELGAQASDLAQRAGVSQDGGFSTAVGAAWGGPASDGSQTVTIGGTFDTSVFGDTTADTTTIGGEMFTIGGGEPDTTMIGGGTFTIGGGESYTIPIGGTFDTSVFGDPGGTYTTTIGGSFDTSVFGDSGQTYSIPIGGTFDNSVFGDPTSSQSVVIGGTFTLDDSSGLGDAAIQLAATSDELYRRALGEAMQTGDFGAISGVIDSHNAAIENLLAPTDHYEYRGPDTYWVHYE
jgi:hypothetical protein